MLRTEIAFATIEELSGLVRSRQLSCREVADRVLERINAYGRKLNCYITVDPEQVRRNADALDALLSAGTWLGPLHGVPVGLKDNIETAGVRTTAGSGVLANWVPEHDAAVVAALKRAGALIVGKQSLYEFAYGYWHPDFGETHNPWDLSKCCGASSSGSACAVVAGLAFGSIGTDTGGSIRLPSAVCGAVGLKPTNELVNRAGVIPASYDLDCVGPLGRTVRDVAVQLGAIADRHDGRVADGMAYLEEIEFGLKGMTIGVPKQVATDEIDLEMRSAFDAALRVMEREGAAIIEIDVPDFSLGRPTNFVIQAGETADYHRQYVLNGPHLYTDTVRRRVWTGAFVPAWAYVRAQRVRQKLRAAFETVMRKVDVLAVPTIPIPAWEVGATQVTVNDGLPEDPLMVFTKYTPMFNVTGQPAMSIPSGFNRRGLPLAFQLAAGWREESTLLRVARAYERVTEWHTQHPALE